MNDEKLHHEKFNDEIRIDSNEDTDEDTDEYELEDTDDIQVIFSQTKSCHVDDANEPKQDSMSSSVASSCSDGSDEVLPWTEKYKPSNCSQVIGHMDAIKRLSAWMDQWSRSSGSKITSKWDDEESNECVTDCNPCILICGPTGCGKTSLVYAVAEETKYKVFELNASMKRSGKIISKIVGEATQSHHVHRSDTQSSSGTSSMGTPFGPRDGFLNGPRDGFINGTLNGSLNGIHKDEHKNTSKPSKDTHKNTSKSSKDTSKQRKDTLKSFKDTSKPPKGSLEALFQQQRDKNSAHHDNKDDDVCIESVVTRRITRSLSCKTQNKRILDYFQKKTNDTKRRKAHEDVVFKEKADAHKEVDQRQKDQRTSLESKEVDQRQKVQKTSLKNTSKVPTKGLSLKEADQHQKDQRVSLESMSKVLTKGLSLTSNSLILFDDVDILIDDDNNGFWNAVNKIIEVTKKPVILTATQYIPYIKECVNYLEVISLQPPDEIQAATALKGICDKEVDDQKITLDACRQLAQVFKSDIRRCINELQFNLEKWSHDAPKSVSNWSPSVRCSETFILKDTLEKSFQILNERQMRDNWMRGHPTLIEDDNHSIGLAKEMADSINELSNNLYKFNDTEAHVVASQSVTQCVDHVFDQLPKNVSKESIILDYCPYLSFICQAEVTRQEEVAGHSRRRLRFLHHLDSIGFYVDDFIKCSLIQTFNMLTSH